MTNHGPCIKFSSFPVLGEKKTWSTMHNTAKTKTTPWHEVQQPCNNIQQHDTSNDAQCHGTKCNASAQCTMPWHDAQHTKLPSTTLNAAAHAAGWWLMLPPVPWQCAKLWHNEQQCWQCHQCQCHQCCTGWSLCLFFLLPFLLSLFYDCLTVTTLPLPDVDMPHQPPVVSQGQYFSLHLLHFPEIFLGKL